MSDQPTQQIDAPDDASTRNRTAESASADGSLRNFLVGLLAVSAVLVIAAAVLESAVG